MRIGSKRFASGLILLFVLALIAAACSSDDSGGDAADTTAAAETTTTAAAAETTTTAAATETTEAMSTEPVIVCELAYFTGEFAAYGPSLTADVEFPISQIINLDPPLGREWQLISEDLVTPGEAQAARICLEQHNAEILVS
ncbi:MAG: hypothetical protein WBN93_08270, partial [Acidimicrobiia bacterium]